MRKITTKKLCKTLSLQQEVRVDFNLAESYAITFFS